QQPARPAVPREIGDHPAAGPALRQRVVQTVPDVAVGAESVHQQQHGLAVATVAAARRSQGSTSRAYFSSRFCASTSAMSSGVICRIPCCFACSAAFFITSSSVFPRTTCVHPEEGSTFAHSRILPMMNAPLLMLGRLRA